MTNYSIDKLQKIAASDIENSSIKDRLQVVKYVKSQGGLDKDSIKVYHDDMSGYITILAKGQISESLKEIATDKIRSVNPDNTGIAKEEGESVFEYETFLDDSLYSILELLLNEIDEEIHDIEDLPESEHQD